MIPKNFPGRGRVAVLQTSPETVLEDYARLMRLAGCEEALPRDKECILNIHLSWHTWYPACSTTPWQLEGVIRTLQADGYAGLIAAHSRNAVADAYVGECRNKHKDIIDAYGIRNVHLYEPRVSWVRYMPKSPMLVLDKLFPGGILIPETFIGRSMVHLPTVKTHAFTVISGAMENACRALLGERRCWSYGVIHEMLVDWLSIQQEIHAGLFAVMDGAFAGDGAGPRAVRWHEKDVILASADLVAVDAVSAKLQGFDPMSIPFIRIAHEMGLGVGDPRDIEVVGYDISGESWGFVLEDTLISRWQKALYQGPLKPLGGLFLRAPLAQWPAFISKLYYDAYWYPRVGRRRVESALQTKWGRLFHSYGDGRVTMPGVDVGTTAVAVGGLASLFLLTAAAYLYRRRQK